MRVDLLSPPYRATVRLGAWRGGAAWSDRAITVDGNLEAWGGRLTPVEDAPVALGAVNDAEFLYVAIRSGNEQAAPRAYRRGLLVWIRPKGGTDIGIQFPLGGSGHHGVPDTSSTTTESFLVFGQGSTDAQRVAVDNMFGTEMKAKLANGELAYELKVPLHRSATHPYALEAPARAQVDLENESPEPSHAGAGEHSGHGGGMGGSPHGGDAEGASAPPMPLKVRAKLELATPPAPR